MHEKMDELRESQWKELLEMQERQILMQQSRSTYSPRLANTGYAACDTRGPNSH